MLERFLTEILWCGMTIICCNHYMSRTSVVDRAWRLTLLFFYE
jgi:hypothetical protein